MSSGADLLEAICPGNVVVASHVKCRGACPKFTSFRDEDFEWALARVTRGHFLSATSEDAALWMLGCEPHSENFGGTLLLSHSSGKWRMIWYKPGVPTDRCHRVDLQNGREVLVCIGSSGGQGFITTALFVEDMLSPKATLMAGESHFFEVGDDVSTCGWNMDNESKPNPLKRGYIEKVSFAVNDRKQSIVSVDARRGTRQMTQDDVKKCIEEQRPAGPHRGLNFDPPATPYHDDFVFDGTNYKRVR